MYHIRFNTVSDVGYHMPCLDLERSEVRKVVLLPADGATIVRTIARWDVDPEQWGSDYIETRYDSRATHVIPPDVSHRTTECMPWWNDQPTFYVSPDGAACHASVAEQDLRETGVWFSEAHESYMRFVRKAREGEVVAVEVW